MTSPLNEGQRAASDGIFDFLYSTGREAIISGPAGVGKTFLMNHVASEVVPRYHQSCKLLGVAPEYDEIVFTATTNKAAEVLSDSIGRPCQTVHSFFNLTVRPDYETGGQKLERTKQWRVHERKVIFVDECSMIDSDLWKEINDGAINSKVIYVGDHCQLAPVAETLSPIYNQHSPMFRLTEPVRNAGQPALMALCDAFRQGVETGVFPGIQEVPGVIDVLDRVQMGPALQAEFSVQAPTARYLAYKNKRVIEVAKHVRQHVRHLPPEFVKGDRLVVGSAYMSGRDRMNVEQEIEVLDAYPKRVDIIDEDHNISTPVWPLEVLARGQMMRVRYPANRVHYDELIDYYKKSKKWKLMYQLKQTFADLRPADSCTVYKSQGSTYETVYVDLADISTCPNPSQALRMLYVAFSRAKSRIVLYGDLAPRFGGPVVRA